MLYLIDFISNNNTSGNLSFSYSLRIQCLVYYLNIKKVFFVAVLNEAKTNSLSILNQDCPRCTLLN